MKLSILIPNSSDSLIKLSTSEFLNNALDGIQPQFRHNPPTASLSINAVFKPSCAALIAETYPPGPPPIIVT